MTAEEVYVLLEQAGIEFEIIEIFEGSRFIRIEVDDTVEDDE